MPNRTGPQGAQGTQGAQGSQGAQGTQGTQGAQSSGNGTSIGIAAASVDTSQTLTSTSYANLATAGPSVTLTTGTSVLVVLAAQVIKTTDYNNMWMSFAVSGASTLAASDARSCTISNVTPNALMSIFTVIPVTGLTAGSNTFTTKYRCDGGTIWSVSNRRLVVIPL